MLDVVNHYNWRHKLAGAAKQGKGSQAAFTDLDETDGWQNKYFTGSFLQNRDLFFFPDSA